MLVCGIFLTACSSDDSAEQQGQIGFVSGFFGGVAADEPRAVLVAKDILGAGGSAADAAVALFFTLAVTKPSHASLGSVGACLAYDQPSKTVRSIDFNPVAPSGNVSPPGTVRGMFALHAAFGRLRWSQVIGPAETLARFGTQATRSLSLDVEASLDRIAADSAAAAIFLRNGRAIREGERFEQLDLATVIGQIRSQGPAIFYGGPLARQYVEAVNTVGGSLTIEEQRGFLPQFGSTTILEAGNHEAHFLPYTNTYGPMQALFWQMLTGDDRLEDAARDERLHLFAEAARRSYSAFERERQRTPRGLTGAQFASESAAESAFRGYSPARASNGAVLQTTEGGTGFVTVDRGGSAVACGLTMNKPFGFGRIAPGTGVFPAASPYPGAISPALSPMLVINSNTNILILAVAGSGEGTPETVVNVAIRTVMGDEAIDVAVASPRIAEIGGTVLVEKEVTALARQNLIKRGQRVREEVRFGLVNAFYCSLGLPDNPKTCMARADWRGHGLAASAQR